MTTIDMVATPLPSPRRRTTNNSTHVLSVIVSVLIGAQVILIPLSFHQNFQGLKLNDQSGRGSPTSSVPSLSAGFRDSYLPNIHLNVTSDRPVRKRRRGGDKPDGFFNGYPIYLRDSNHHPIHSSVQCVGENYRDTAWIHRSCKFRHFCFDTEKQDFVMYQSEEELALKKAIQNKTFIGASTHMDQHVAIGGINTKWTWRNNGVPRLKWFPKVVTGALTESYYELDPDVVWVPFHSLFAANPGHLVWDDFLPIYTLLRIFQLFEDYQPLLMRYILEGEGMWASCDWTDEKKTMCSQMFAKFLPLFGLHRDNFTTNQNFRFEVKGDKKSKLVCAVQGVAGMGMLTDHGMKLHGWTKKDYESMHNHGRGAMLFEFRNFMVSNVGLSVQKLPKRPPYMVTFAVSTSRSTLRSLDFTLHKEAIKKAYGAKVKVQEVYFPAKKIREQVQIATETAIYVTVCGGGAVTATFLPLGSSVVLYYVENGGVQNNRLTGLPARLDWDLFNNMAWIRSHWLPANSMNNDTDVDAFVKLVGHEIDLMDDQILD